MAVRQITRSSQLAQILNGFGHCTSHSAILTYETDLAKLAIKSDCCIPQGVEKHKFTCLVYGTMTLQKIVEIKPIYLEEY